jgi:hypothetical protein
MSNECKIAQRLVCLFTIWNWCHSLYIEGRHIDSLATNEDCCLLQMVVANGLHILSTHQPLHHMLVIVGIIKALCW